jgi:hypothetical protein
MDNLNIEKTTQTPKVIFDAQKGTLVISGRSLPEDSSKFYHPLFKWLDNYFENPQIKTFTKFELDYFNTSSAKAIFSLLMKLEKAHYSGHPVSVEWFYDSDDEDMFELGDEYRGLFKMPIVLVKKSNE